jgi:8-oxo-dGTP pyrophosphatase MutT (NUDIX family)
MQKPTLVSSKPVYDGKVIKVAVERVRYANGREYDIDFVRHPGASAVVAVDDDNRVCLVRQYRHGVNDFMWEIPAGKLDPGEAPDACAERELAEETGITASRWTSMGIYVPAPALFTEVIHMYLARGLKVGAARPDDDEELDLQWMPFEEAVEHVQRGDWNDGKTAFGLMRAQYQLHL